MKKLFYITTFTLAMGCATKPAPTTVKSQTLPACTLTNSSACTPQKPSEPVAAQEVKPFFESVNPSAISDASADNLPLTTDISELNEASPKNKVVEFDIPIVMNEDVERWIKYFTTSGRKFYASWLARSGKYIPMMQSILKEHGLPQDLVYLSMIESGFKPYAYSRAKAMGCWQFMRGTGSMYGLRVDWSIDERRDPEKSTIAAAEHLRDLYDQFNHWYLAAASYNAGSGKITRAMQRYSTEDFWEMTQFRYLKPETKNYVPKLIAAAVIAKQPEAYGFTDIAYEEPIKYAKVHVPEPIELRVAAQKMDLDVEVLEDLNPELLRGVTPLNYPEYELKVPVGTESVFLEKYSEIRQESVVKITRHTVSSKDTLGTIARRYGVTIGDLMSANQLRSSRVRAGQSLVIPARSSRKNTNSAPVRTRKKNVSLPQASVSDKHHVQKGDTLWSISKKYDVSVSDLKAWNNVSAGELHAGKSINVKSPEVGTLLKPKKAGRSAEWTSYRVKSGDSLWTISRQHDVSVSELQNWNNLERGKIFPGKILKIKSR